MSYPPYCVLYGAKVEIGVANETVLVLTSARTASDRWFDGASVIYTAC